MPELPEVETTRRGISPLVQGERVERVLVRERRLRWPIPEAFEAWLVGRVIESVGRRGKYLLLDAGGGWVMLHLGMSGSLRILDREEAQDPARVGRHDHLDITFSNSRVLRFHDPRRFGSVHYFEHAPELHPLLATLGPEPLDELFTADYLYERSRGRRVAIKSFIMDNRQVVGVGNIYASEALFLAGIDPRRAAGRISRARMVNLVATIREVLAQAIAVGGTTLRDFVGGDGKPGYFQQSLYVYGRAGKPCKRCGTLLRELKLGQRSSVFCPSCQR